jgi:hypothetical protein
MDVYSLLFIIIHLPLVSLTLNSLVTDNTHKINTKRKISGRLSLKVLKFQQKKGSVNGRGRERKERAENMA